MTRKNIQQGSEFETKMGYSRAVAQGDWVFVSGTTGFDYATMAISDDVAEQTAQCLENIQWALAQADANLSDVVRVKYILPDGDDFPQCFSALGAAFASNPPAATMFVAGLADPRMKIEIEVTALKGA